MAVLRTAILTHSLLREVPCCLCGSKWDEQLVGVALMSGEATLGDICPRCLSREPAEAAARLRSRSPAASEAGRGPRGAAEDIEDLLLVADRLVRMSRWGTTVPQVVEAERHCFLLRFGCLDELTLRRAVDDRYRELLATS